MTESKFCPNCGMKQEKETKFCIHCGCAFETKAMPIKTSQRISKYTLPKFNIKGLVGNKKLLIGVGVVIVLIATYLIFGGIDIAGSYESEYTIGDNEYSNTMDITRKGKLILTEVDLNEGMKGEITLQIMSNDAHNGYVLDPSKGMEVRLRVSDSNLSDNSYEDDINYLVNGVGLKQEEKNGEIVVSGKITTLEAENHGIYFINTEVFQYENTKEILFDDTIYIKQ